MQLDNWNSLLRSSILITTFEDVKWCEWCYAFRVPKKDACIATKTMIVFKQNKLKKNRQNICYNKHPKIKKIGIINSAKKIAKGAQNVRRVTPKCMRDQTIKQLVRVHVLLFWRYENMTMQMIVLGETLIVLGEKEFVMKTIFW